MAWKFPRGHAETKALIAQCAADGVGIDRLENTGSRYCTFRFVPVERVRESFNGREHCKPSGRGTVACGKAKPWKLKNWTPAKLSLTPQYDAPMLGDPWELTKARKAWLKGDPEPLREYLAAEAAKRRAAPEPIQLPLAA